jgi:hypothetical protein
MKNIHILPTDKPSRLFYDISLAKLILSEIHEKPNGWFENKHTYITSDEEIKQGDWYYYFGHIVKYDKDENTLTRNCKKIILTTDQDLIKDGVQAIDDEFLEWFIKNQSCESVEIEHNYIDWVIDSYEIIIPKEKQIKCYCGHTITCDCEPLQETIEEAAEKHWKMQYIMALDESTKPYIIEDFIAGAKWQSERMYSEEDMMKAYYQGHKSGIGSEEALTFKKWFEQFKKKFG